jgi:hypothetical protein
MWDFLSDYNGYGDQTLVWEPLGVLKTDTKDVKYSVIIDNVMVNGLKKKYEYEVNILKM